MIVCMGYEKLSTKKKLAVLNALLADFTKLAQDFDGPPTYKNVINELLTERAEVASQIGR